MRWVGGGGGGMLADERPPPVSSASPAGALEVAAQWPGPGQPPMPDAMPPACWSQCLPPRDRTWAPM